MIELIIGLVAIMVLTVAMLQLATLTRVQSQIMTDARREAGDQSMRPLFAFATPDFIAEWRTGTDAKPYTRDDRFTRGDEAGFNQMIVERAAPGAAGWQQLYRAPAHELPDLRNAVHPAQHFGLVRGRANDSVPLLSAVQSLLYRAEQIDLEATVWMTWAEGIY